MIGEIISGLYTSNARRKTSGGRLNRADIARGEKKKDLVYGNKTTESQSAQRTTTPGGIFQYRLE
jgi:hypothetical protein